MNREKMMASQLETMETSEAVIKKHSSTFYYAFSKLPLYQALSIFVVYDFLRQLDDAADNNNVEQFQLIKGIWESVKNGKPNTSLGKIYNLFFKFFKFQKN